MSKDLTSSEAAEYIGHSLGTVLRWSNEGFLPHYRTNGNQRRFIPAVLDELKKCYLQGVKDPDEQKRRMHAKQEELANATNESASVR